MCNPIRVDISTKHPLGHGVCVCGSGENNPGNLFALSVPQKDKNPLTHNRSSKYDAGQEIRTGTPESSDVIIGEVLKTLSGERRTNTGCDGRRGIIQCRPPTDSK